MPAKVISLLLALVFAGGCAYCQPERALAAYRKANILFNSTHPTDITDSLALTGFEEVIEQLKKTSSFQHDSLLFQSLS